MSETLMTQAENSTEGSTSTSEATAKVTEVKTEVVQAQASDKQAEAQESKQEETAKTESEAKDEKADSKAEEPVELADFTAPEGVKLDSEAASELKSLAKELGLKQEGAQKVADIGVKLAQKWEARQAEALKEMKSSWVESSKADKEIGGDKLNENLAVAKKALDVFGTPELKTLLNESGLGSHPEIVRAFYRAGKAISEDRFVPSNGSTTSTGSRDLSKTLYPNQNQ